MPRHREPQDGAVAVNARFRPCRRMRGSGRFTGIGPDRDKGPEAAWQRPGTLFLIARHGAREEQIKQHELQFVYADSFSISLSKP